MAATLGERLRILIKESGLKQQDAARILNIKTPTFNGYVRDKREPGIDTLKKLADFFNVSIDYLTGYSNIRSPYLPHLDSKLREFVFSPENKAFIEIARDIWNKTSNSRSGVM